MNNNRKTVIGVVLLVIMAIVMVSGCASNKHDLGQEGPQINNDSKNIILCPNEDCPLHHPASTNRPIDMEYDDSVPRSHYLCQICGERWSE